MNESSTLLQSRTLSMLWRAIFVVRPFLGRALDRWGRRPFLLLGLLGYVVAMFIFCLSDTVLLLTVARFVQGLGQAFAYFLGAALGPLAGGWLYDNMTTSVMLRLSTSTPSSCSWACC